MTDGASKNLTSGPIDLGRLVRPDSEAFRYIAETLGARFAGDGGDDNVAPLGEAVPPVSIRPGEGPTAERTGGVCGDTRAAKLFEKLPFSIVVVDKGGIAFVNRAARDALGYTASVLDAAGGLGVLLSGTASRKGAMAVTTAGGHVFDARVHMTPVDWASRRAIAVTIEPFRETAPLRPSPEKVAGKVVGEGEDALTDLLSANPDPVAIVSRSGRVEAANHAFRALGPDAAKLGLEARIDAPALEKLLSHVGSAFQGPVTKGSDPVTVEVAGADMLVTIGVLKSAEFACLVFRPVQTLTARSIAAENASFHASTPHRSDGSPLDTAVQKARRLVRDAAVLIVMEGTAALPFEVSLADETERFFRAVLVSMGARAPAGTVISVERRDARYAISVSPHADGVLEDVAQSARLVLYGLEAGLAIGGLDDNRLDIAPIRHDTRKPLTTSG